MEPRVVLTSMNGTVIRTAFVKAFPLALVATLVLGISYVNEQQTIRLLAYEPQEYVVADAALRVSASGALPASGFSTAVPIEEDPAAYLVFFDATGTPLAGTGVLGGQPPRLPDGVLATAAKQGVDRLTWEPTKGVRQAIVVRPAGPGFVMSGRSLAYAESLEQKLLARTALGWLGTMLAILLVSFFLAHRARRTQS